jgi:cytochrome P450
MVNTLAWSIGTFAHRPDIQEKAYQSICEVYGNKSWGPIEDETAVPYITALVKEILRVFCVLRISLPRAAWKDIQYGDFFIPKGTTVFLNAWGCNRDESVYGSDVDVFRPERFLDDPDLPHAAYGFGTRMCAGFHLANRQMYIFLLRLLWSFKIEMSKDPLDNNWQARPLEVSYGAPHAGKDEALTDDIGCCRTVALGCDSSELQSSLCTQGSGCIERDTCCLISLAI